MLMIRPTITHSEWDRTKTATQRVEMHKHTCAALAVNNWWTDRGPPRAVPGCHLDLNRSSWSDYSLELARSGMSRLHELCSIADA